jgi:hypothetical protein
VKLNLFLKFVSDAGKKIYANQQREPATSVLINATMRSLRSGTTLMRTLKNITSMYLFQKTNNLNEDDIRK